MEKYDYHAALVNDIKQYINDNPSEWADPLITDNIEDYWYDLLWDQDSVTGNGFNWYDTEDKCSEYLSQNFNLLYEAFQEFCIDDSVILIKQYEDKTLARYFDCTIRCYLLMECIQQALEELNDEMGRLSEE